MTGVALSAQQLVITYMHYWFPALASWVIVTIKLEPVEHFNVFLSNIWGKMELQRNRQEASAAQRTAGNGQYTCKFLQEVGS